MISKTLGVPLFAALLFTASAGGAQSSDRYWVAESAGKCSDAANWSGTAGGRGGAGVPGPADRAVFDGKGVGDALFDARFSGKLGSVVIRPGYTGKVTQERNLWITGDLAILGGSAVGWTFAEDQPAELRVGGNLTVATHKCITCSRSSTAGDGRGRTIRIGRDLILFGTITADGKGFMKGPGTPAIPGARRVTSNAADLVDRYVGGADTEAQSKSCPVSPAGPGHGGRGAGIYRNPNGQYTVQPHMYYWTEPLGSGTWRFPGGNTYGSIVAPTSLGSGTAADPYFDPKNPYPYDTQNSFWTHKGAYGGGAISLEVKGTARIEGRVTANGALAGETGASGGSVFLVAGRLMGRGVICANGSDAPGHGHGRGGGGGGRVSVILKNASTTAGVKLQAFGGEGRWSPSAAAGTIYLETPRDKSGHGTLIVDNQNKPCRTMYDICTSINDKHNASYTFNSVILKSHAILYIGRGRSLTTSSLASTNGNVIVDGGKLSARTKPGLKAIEIIRPQDEVTRRLGPLIKVFTFGSSRTMDQELLTRSCQISFYPYLSKLDVSADLSTYAYQADVADVRSAGVAVVSKADGTRVAQGKLLFDAKQFAQSTIALPQLKAGGYDVCIDLDSGQRIDPITFSREKLPWERNRLGVTDKVYYPFEPLKVEGGQIRLCCGRTYTVNGFGLFDTIISQGREISAGPATIKMETADGVEDWKLSGGKFVSAKPSATEYVAEAESQAVRLLTDTTIEFDGCAKVEMDLLPGSKSEEIKRLWVEIPLKDSETPLMHTSTLSGIRWNYAGATPKGGQIEWENPLAAWSDRRPPIWWVKAGTQGRTDGVVWNSSNVRGAISFLVNPFVPYIWLGGAERGLAWFADSDSGWIVDPATPGQTVSREGDKVVMRIYLINKPTTLTGKHHIVFGLQASPSKPLMPDFRTVTRRGYHGYMTPAFGMFCCTKFPVDHDFSLVDKSIQNKKDKAAGKKVGPQFVYDKVDQLKAKGWPEDMTADAWLTRWLVTAWNNIVEDGPQSGIYFEEHWTDPGQTDVDTFGNEWAARRYLGYWPIREKNRVVYDSPSATDSGLTGRFLSGSYSESLVDFSVYYANEYLKRGVGLYFDNTYPHICTNPNISEAHETESGKIQPAVHIWNQREYYKRIWNLMSDYNEKNPEHPVYFTHHMTNAQILPWNEWTTTNLDNENTWTDVERKIHVAPFPWQYLLTETVGRQVGTPGHTHYPVGGADAPLRREWGMRIVHELGSEAGGVWGFPFEKVFREFGYGKDGVQIINYWNDDPRVQVTNDDVKWIAMVRQGQPTTMLVLQSYCFDPASTKVKLDGCKAWLNAETGEHVAVSADGAADISFKEGYGTVILVGGPTEAGLSAWGSVLSQVKH